MDKLSVSGFDLVVERDVMVPMRDGVKLLTDIYRPAHNGQAATGPFPVILERTPYGKADARFVSQGEFFAKRGYVFVIQDVRGRYASEGTFLNYIQEPDDGCDTVQWLNRQPWSNGKIGLTGSSYSAATLNAILIQSPPGLAAAVMRQGTSNYHEDGAWQGGAFELLHNIGNTLSLAVKGSKEVLANPSIRDALEWALQMDHYIDELHMYPKKPGTSSFALVPSYDKMFQDWQNHEFYDAFWKQNGYNVEEFYGQVADVPVLVVGSWYDRFNRGTLNNFLGYSHKNKSPVALFMSPTIHGSENLEKTLAGDIEFGKEAALNDAISGEKMRGLTLWWFDHWLKSIDNGVKETDVVRLFRMGGGSRTRNQAGRMQNGGIWQEFTTWPPADVKLTNFYLTPNMDLQTEVSAAGAIMYTYDPTNPVPTVGGNINQGGKVAPGGPYDQRCRKDLPLCRNTLPLNRRPDVLSFVTPPLSKDIEVTGPLTVNLWISSTAVDTDFTAKLIDLYPPSPDYPDGYAMNLADSIVRARFRAFQQLGPNYHRAYGIREELLKPGEIYHVVIDLWATSNLFCAGHRIRLDISSSNFPRFDANPNTGEPFPKRRLPPVLAHNTIHMGPEHPSHIILPIR